MENYPPGNFSTLKSDTWYTFNCKDMTRGHYFTVWRNVSTLKSDLLPESLYHNPAHVADWPSVEMWPLFKFDPMLIIHVINGTEAITKTFLGEDPRPPSITIVLNNIMLCIHINNQIKFKHAANPFTNILYAHAHTSSQQNKITRNSCPASPLNQTFLPSPPWFFFLWSLKFSLRLKIYILALVYLKMNFPAEPMLRMNNPSRQNFPVP